MKESQIQTQIINYLNGRKDLFFQRTNNIAAPNGRGGYKSMGKGQKAGFPDIIIIKDGEFIGVELKGDDKYIRDGKVNKAGDWKKVQSEDQLKMEEDIKKNGGKYYVIRSLDELVEVL